MSLFAFFAPGPTEIVLIILGVLLLFGGKKIPELMKGLGSGMREFKKASTFDEPETTPAGRIDPNKAETTTSEKKAASGS